MTAKRITIEWEDGLVGVFTKQPDGSWMQTGLGTPGTGFGAVRVGGYDPANVMRVLATATGTREIAE